MMLGLRQWLPLALLASFACGEGAAPTPAGAAVVASDPTREPFPARALRLAETPPDLTGLTDHSGTPLTAEDLAGQVVVMTSVYACCPLACPVLLTEARLAVEAVPAAQRQDLVVLAVTMDPEQDTPEKLAELAATFGAGPEWRFLTGTPARIDAVLDAMGVERERNAETGEIDHNAVFLFVDRAGKLAYRLGMPDENRRHWHVGAMTTLLDEQRPGT